jgi:hypothetical protein
MSLWLSARLSINSGTQPETTELSLRGKSPRLA